MYGPSSMDCLRLWPLSVRRTPGAPEIGVATPYRGQKKFLEDHLKDKAFVRFVGASE